MYAVIKTGGKQQRVQVGDIVEVERLVDAGESITFQPLLVVDDDGKTHVGTEAERAVVKAKPLGETKGDKVKIFKYRPKTGYAKRAGHRQILTLLEIEEVSLGAAAPKKAAPKKEAKAQQAKPAAEAEAEPETTAEEGEG